MSKNFFTGFREFSEEGMPQGQPNPVPPQQNAPQQNAPGLLDVMKKQMRVPKKIWKGLPFTVGANKRIKMDGKVFTGPMTFYVDEFDDATVTLKLVRNPLDFTNMDDEDDEIDMDNTDDGGEQRFVIPRTVFEKLLEPDNQPGADFSTPAQQIFAPR